MRNSGKPAYRSSGRPGNRPSGRQGDRPSGGPRDRPYGRQGGRPGGRPGDRSGDDRRRGPPREHHEVLENPIEDDTAVVSPVSFTEGTLFADLGVKPTTVDALRQMNITNATPVQEAAIPIIMNGKNIIAQAQTGSGKTLAYSIPVLENLDKAQRDVQCLILVPTRELCKQVSKVFEELSKNDRSVSVVEVYGGVSVGPQMDRIERGAQVIVATPGRLMDLYDRGIVRFDHVKWITLDEADRMLDMGFFPDIEFILNKVKAVQRTPVQFLLFSATIMEEIKKLARTFTPDYEEIDISKDDLTVAATSQYYYSIWDHRRKYEFFKKILQIEKPQHAIIFTNTKRTAEFLERRLIQDRLPYSMRGLHGNMGQGSREKVLISFKKREFNLMIATDVAARGLDIDDVDFVFQYDVPQYEENYVHRVGRTSRMGKVGAAVMLSTEDEYAFICRIEGFINKSLIRKHLPGEDELATYGDNRGGPRGGSRGGSRGGQGPYRRDDRRGGGERDERMGEDPRDQRQNDDDNWYGDGAGRPKHPFF